MSITGYVPSDAERAAIADALRAKFPTIDVDALVACEQSEFTPLIHADGERRLYWHLQVIHTASVPLPPLPDPVL